MLLLSLLLVSCCLRAPITCVGPLAGVIAGDLNLAAGATGMLTTIPLLAFAAASILVGRFSGHFGAGRVMLGGMAALAAGIVLRSCAGAAGLFVGTVVLGAGIAIGNVLIPALIKAYFPDRLVLLTGAYTSLLSAFSGLSGAISVPLALVWGWKGALVVWIVLALAALGLWLPQRRCTLRDTVAAPSAPRVLLRTPLTWQIALYMGVQSLVFYCFAAWFATMVHDGGFSSQTAGYFHSAYMLLGIPGTLAVPALAARWKNLPALAALIGGIYCVGMVAMLFSHRLPLLILALVCCGFCAGACLSFVMALFGLHTRSAADASFLSGFAQAVGYLLAAVGPTLMGRLYDLTAGWTAPLGLLLVLTAVLTVLGWHVGKDGIIGALVPAKKGE